MSKTVDHYAAGCFRQDRRANRPYSTATSARQTENVRLQRLLTRIRRHEVSGDQAVAKFVVREAAKAAR